MTNSQPKFSSLTWYLLFEGFSCDGTGEPSYVSRTTHYNEAKEFLAKNADSPYHFDKVVAVTDFEYRQFRSVRDLDSWATMTQKLC